MTGVVLARGDSDLAHFRAALTARGKSQSRYGGRLPSNLGQSGTSLAGPTQGACSSELFARSRRTGRLAASMPQVGLHLAASAPS